MKSRKLVWLGVGSLTVLSVAASLVCVLRSHAVAEVIDPLCPDGGVCAKYLDDAGGCTTLSCCPQGQTYCAGVFRTSYPFPRYISAYKGVCVRASQTSQHYCYTRDCGGAYLCGESCVPVGDAVDLSQPLPEVLGACDRLQ